MRDTAVSPDGISIAYDVEGVGSPALVFVHGWSCDRTYWAPQMRAFARGHTVVAIDLAGHGESGDGRGSWTMEAFGGDVTAVLDRLGIDDIVLIGHSMGGDVIVETAMARGDRLRGLVWVDTYNALGSRLRQAKLDEFVQPFGLDFVGSVRELVHGMFPPGANPELVNWVAEDMASAPPAIARDALPRAIGNAGPILDRLVELRVPIVAINPDYRPNDEASLRQYGVRSVIMSGVGHFSMLEDPDQFNRVLAEVIEAFG
jgi:pimeloyl-ACP methyl ester carboxylesterase